MKKYWLVFVASAALLLAYGYGRLQRTSGEPRLLAEQSSPALGKVANIPNKHLKQPGALSKIWEGHADLLQLILSHSLNPDSLEAYARDRGFALDRSVLGQARSGQRLVIKVGSVPESTVVFDILANGSYQLSAVRSTFSADIPLADLKTLLKNRLQLPVDREDAKSLVFKNDQDGLVVWLAENDDGSIKMASEYAAQGSPDR